MRPGLNFANSISCKSIEAIAALIYHGFDNLTVHDVVDSFKWISHVLFYERSHSFANHSARKLKPYDVDNFYWSEAVFAADQIGFE